MEVNPPRAKRADGTREALERAAVFLFGTKGYAEAPIEEVARRAGVTKGALYHHFRDKPELFAAALARRVRELGQEASRLSRERMEREGRERRGWDRLEAGFGVFLEQLADPSVRRMLLVDGPAVLGRARWEQVWFRQNLLPVRRVLEQIGVARGRIEPLARTILAGAQEAAQLAAESSDPDGPHRAFVDALMWVLRALQRQVQAEVRAARA